MITINVFFILFFFDYILYENSKKNVILILLTYLFLANYYAFLCGNLFLLLFIDKEYFWRLSKLIQILTMCYFYNYYIISIMLLFDIFIF